MKNTFIGGILVLLVVTTLWFLKSKKDDSPGAEPVTNETRTRTDVAKVRGFVGGEKMGFVQNPKIVRILREKYGIELVPERKGSVEMVTTEPVVGVDFLWPASQNQVETYRHSGRMANADEVIFVSPIVVFSWDMVQSALSTKGLVRQGDAAYIETADLARIVTTKTKWSDVGLSQIFGSVRVAFTDPVRSNSGAQFLALLATILTGDDALTPANVANVQPAIRTLLDTQGFAQGSSGELFSQYLKQGPGAFPLVAGYENQLIEFAKAHPEMAELIQSRLRILYPRPTIWSNHPVIALTDGGKKLITALRDPEIRALAWSEHGFRTEVSAIDPKAVSQFQGIPLNITSAVPNPASAVMDALFPPGPTP